MANQIVAHLRIHDAGPAVMSITDAMATLIDLRQRLLDADRKSTGREAEAIGFGLRALETVARDYTTGGAA